ncbi:MAG: hypothetical protein HF974_10190 [ANME-2 cluster archaeon]|nr:hypothetical protein [ANME-2 cluster archaeon]
MSNGSLCVKDNVNTRCCHGNQVQESSVQWWASGYGIRCRFLLYVRNRSAVILAPVFIMVPNQIVFSNLYAAFLTGVVNFLFTDINDHAMLMFEIIMKRESGYFTHIAVYMPE